MAGRNFVLNAIVRGENLPNPGIPESFKVLVLELQSLGLDIGMYQLAGRNFEYPSGREVNLMNTSASVTPIPSYKSIEIL